MCWLRHGLRWRAAGLIACVPRPPFRSLAAARSLVAIRSVSLVPFVPARGVVGRFMGYSARYLVGVGVSQNMPLNGILWLLMGIFDDGVRCPFSALFHRLVLAPLLGLLTSLGCGVIALVRAFSCGELGETARLRSFGPGSFFRFLRHDMDGVGDWLSCRADGVCGSSCLPLSARASPAPWGGGICAVCGRRLRWR